MSGANGSCGACRWFDETERVTAPTTDREFGGVYHSEIRGMHLCKLFPRAEQKHSDDWCGQFESRRKA